MAQLFAAIEMEITEQKLHHPTFNTCRTSRCMYLYSQITIVMQEYCDHRFWDRNHAKA